MLSCGLRQARSLIAETRKWMKNAPSLSFLVGPLGFFSFCALGAFPPAAAAGAAGAPGAA